MTADEIRKQWHPHILGRETVEDMPYHIACMFAELTAQLAEFNATMGGIATGLDKLTDADYPRVAVKVRQA